MNFSAVDGMFNGGNHTLLLFISNESDYEKRDERIQKDISSGDMKN